MLLGAEGDAPLLQVLAGGREVGGLEGEGDVPKPGGLALPRAGVGRRLEQRDAGPEGAEEDGLVVGGRLVLLVEPERLEVPGDRAWRSRTFSETWSSLCR